MSRPRDAPIAWRSAISRSRTLARASSRLARLAQAISSTSPVVASRSHSGVSYWRRSPETPVAPVVAASLFARYFLASSGRYVGGRVASMIAGERAWRCAVARWGVQPGFSRPITFNQFALR